MAKKSLLYTAFIFSIAVYACTSSSTEKDIKSSSAQQATQKVKLIFDTDMGSDCDDVGALALLHQYANEEKVEILGCIYSSGKVPYGAGVIDAINHYYKRPNLPIGASYDTLVGDNVDKMSAEKLAKDTTSFGHDIILNSDALEQMQLSRKLLANQEDSSVTYLTIGHTKGLYDLLTSKPDEISSLSGEELIGQKVKKWVALGALDANNPDNERRKDWNFFFNGTAPYTEYLVRNFPVPIYFVNGGKQVMTGKSLENTPASNIVRQAYTTWLNWHGGKTLADQRPSWDLVTVYFAVEGLGDYFRMEENGWLDFNAENGCIWRKTKNEYQHFYITQKADTDSAFAAYLNKIIALPPKLDI